MEELEKKALELALKMGDGVELAVNRLYEEAPLYVQELLIYYFWSHLFWGILGIVALISVAVFFFKVIKKIDDSDPLCFLGFLTCILLSMIFIGVALVNLEESLKIGVAPRVYVVDYIKDGLSGSK